jgi:hypothetical protein
VTWLPADDGGSERDAVLGLKPEPYEAVRRVLTAAWSATDPAVLELCRRRLAQLSSARAELTGLDGWEAGRRFTPHERAALAFAEQYHYDHRLLAGGLTDALSEHLTRRQLVNFVWALQMNDAYIRILSLLDIAPDPAGAPARPERSQPTRPWTPPAADDDADGRASVKTLMEPELEAAYRVLNPVVVRQSLVDDVTSEAIRLRNASHQACHY